MKRIQKQNFIFSRNTFYFYKMKVEKLCWSIEFDMSLEFGILFGHSVDLIVVVLLSRSLRKVSGSPLEETSGQLFDTDYWIFTVVLVNISFT